MTRQDNAKAIRAVVADFAPIKLWADTRRQTALDALAGGNANDIAATAKLMGMAEAYGQMAEIEAITKRDSER